MKGIFVVYLIVLMLALASCTNVTMSGGGATLPTDSNNTTGNNNPSNNNNTQPTITNPTPQG